MKSITSPLGLGNHVHDLT